jgi:hypothetical protein
MNHKHHEVVSGDKIKYSGINDYRKPVDSKNRKKIEVNFLRATQCKKQFLDICYSFLL